MLDAQRPDVHAFAADANAAITQDAAWTVEEDHGRPLLLLAMILQVDELRFGSAVLEGHVLEFAFAAGVADRAVERVICQQQLEHRLARLFDLVALGGHHHALLATGVVHAVWSLGIFSIFTRHMRQAPCNERPG